MTSEGMYMDFSSERENMTDAYVEMNTISAGPSTAEASKVVDTQRTNACEKLKVPVKTFRKISGNDTSSLKQENKPCKHGYNNIVENQGNIMTSEGMYMDFSSERENMTD